MRNIFILTFCLFTYSFCNTIFCLEQTSNNLYKSFIEFDAKPKTLISGSYRKHLSSLIKLKKFLEDEGIIVLSPVSEQITNPGEEFALLEKDPIKDKRLLQDSIFAKIRSSTFLVLANVDGYIGNAALLEIGYAIATGIQILTLEPVSDPNLSPYCRPLKEIFPNLR